MAALVAFQKETNSGNLRFYCEISIPEHSAPLQRPGNLVWQKRGKFLGGFPFTADLLNSLEKRFVSVYRHRHGFVFERQPVPSKHDMPFLIIERYFKQAFKVDDIVHVLPAYVSQGLECLRTILNYPPIMVREVANYIEIA